MTWDCYIRIQESAEAGAIEWIDMHRHYGREQRDGDKVRATGTSDMVLRNQYAAWLEYITGDWGQVAHCTREEMSVKL